MTTGSMEQLYQQVILDHAKYPHGKGLPPETGPIGVAFADHADTCGVSHQVNPTCGDELTVRVDVDTTGASPVLRDLRWDGQGCSISQASASVLHDLVVGQPLTTVDALHASFRALMQSRGAGLDDEAAEESLGDAAAFTGVSRYSARVKCALLGWVAMSDALILSGARTQEDA